VRLVYRHSRSVQRAQRLLSCSGGEDTGFGTVLPTGEGFAFNSMAETSILVFATKCGKTNSGNPLSANAAVQDQRDCRSPRAAAPTHRMIDNAFEVLLFQIKHSSVRGCCPDNICR